MDRSYASVLRAEGKGCVTRVLPSARCTSSIVRCLDPESAGFATWRWAVLRPRTLAASLRDILRAAPSYIGIGIFHELKLNHTVGSLNFSERTGGCGEACAFFLLYLKRPALVCLLALRLPMVRKRAGWVLTL